jgi:hypothetical protein
VFVFALCVCVCVCVCICVYLCVCMGMCMCVLMCVCVYVRGLVGVGDSAFGRILPPREVDTLVSVEAARRLVSLG